MNRIGDVGFALGILAICATVGTLDIGPALDGLVEKTGSGELAPWMVTGIALLVFAGAMGKSAQFPLHVWLPDAMEGPTPVGGVIARGAKAIDERVVDGIVNAVGRLTLCHGGGLRRVQTGRVQNYAPGIVLGLLAMVAAYFFLVSR